MPLTSKCATSFSKQPWLQANALCIKQDNTWKQMWHHINKNNANNYIFIYEKNANATFSKETHFEYLFAHLDQDKQKQPTKLFLFLFFGV
jgi:hypothetical protein